MTRSIGSNFNTQITSGQVQPFMAVSLGFSTPLNLWTGYHDITIGSDTYVGGGNLLEISSIQESSEVKATGMSIALSGLDSSIVSSALTENVQGTVVKVFFGVLETSSNATAIVDTPYQFFEGFLDTMIISDEGDTSKISITVENKLITLEKPVDRRYTDQDQKNLFTGDRGLEYVDSLQDKEIVWGGGST
jgi:hypothetical protein|tara:strand:+ start:5312 stop:5884 length:573 start_codon:yes stop_codon:yes gene_type:complete